MIPTKAGRRRLARSWDEPLPGGLTLRNYPRLIDLECDGFMDEYVRLQRYVWGHQGVCEYAVCCRPECRALVSVEEARRGAGDDLRATRATGMSADPKTTASVRGGWLPYDEFEKTGPWLTDCPEDAAHGFTELYLEPDLLAHHLRQYAETAAGVIVLGPGGELLGFGDAWIGRLAEAVTAVNYRHGYDQDEAVTAFLGATGCRADGLVLSLNKLAIVPTCRQAGLFRKIMSSMIDVALDAADVAPAGLPVLGDTRRDSRIWPHLSANGFVDLCEDVHGWVLTATADLEGFRHSMGLSSADYHDRSGAALSLARDEVELASSTSGRRFYTQAVHLREQQLEVCRRTSLDRAEERPLQDDSEEPVTAFKSWSG